LRGVELGMPGVVGEPGLATQRTGIGPQQLVVVADHELWLGTETGEQGFPGAEQLDQQGTVEHLAEDQRQVVG
jgi:hypothetical protein